MLRVQPHIFSWPFLESPRTSVSVIRSSLLPLNVSQSLTLANNQLPTQLLDEAVLLIAHFHRGGSHLGWQCLSRMSPEPENIVPQRSDLFVLFAAQDIVRSAGVKRRHLGPRL